MITLESVQLATKRCLDEFPVMDGELPPESERLIELLGKMNYYQMQSIDEADVPQEAQTALKRWTADPTRRR